MTDDELTRTLLDLEHRGWESLRDGSGADFYGALMTEDGVMVLANGGVADREAVVESLRGARCGSGSRSTARAWSRRATARPRWCTPAGPGVGSRRPRSS